MNRTALLFFSRSPVAETDHKVIFPGDKRKNRAIIELLYKNSLKEATGSGLDVITFDESRQRGDTFGERFANAFQQLFDEGYKQVISIGNDCPAIGQVQWKSICSLLDNGETVVGPTPGGGAYLIAVTAEHFDYEPFKKLPWQSPGLLQDFIYYFREQNYGLTLLRCRLDINRFHDARIYLKSYTTPGEKQIRQQLSSIIYVRQIAPGFLISQFDGFTAATSSRAPPLS